MTEHANDPWGEFLDHVEAYHGRCRRELEAFGLGSHERFDCDFDTGELWFSNGGVRAVEAEILVAGSVSKETGTWLWSWANPHLPDLVKQRVATVRDYGVERGFEQLVDEKFPATEADGMWLAAAACYVLQGQGVYRAPGSPVSTFLILFGIRRVEH